MTIMRVYADGVLRRADVYLESAVMQAIQVATSELSAALQNIEVISQFGNLGPSANATKEAITKLANVLQLATRQKTDLEAYAQILEASSPCLEAINALLGQVQEKYMQGHNQLKPQMDVLSSTTNAVGYLVNVVQTAQAGSSGQPDVAQPAQEPQLVPGEYPPHPHSRPAASTSSPIQFTGSRRKMRIMAQQGSPLRQYSADIAQYLSELQELHQQWNGPTPGFAQTGLTQLGQKVNKAKTDLLQIKFTDVKDDIGYEFSQQLNNLVGILITATAYFTNPNASNDPEGSFTEAENLLTQATQQLDELAIAHESHIAEAQQQPTQPAPAQQPSTMDENETRGNVGWATR